MRAFITCGSRSGAALAAVVAIGGCGSSQRLAADTTKTARVAPLAKSIDSFFHAISVDRIECGGPAGRRRLRSCQVEFTDSYGVWWATIIVAGQKMISDPGGVADWLCAGSCANPPGIKGNTGNPRNNPGGAGTSGSEKISGQTGVTGIGGVVNSGASGRGGAGGAETISGATGVVSGSGASGVVSGSGASGVVSGSGSGVLSGSGSSGVTGSNGAVYGTGSTGAGR